MTEISYKEKQSYLEKVSSQTQEWGRNEFINRIVELEQIITNKTEDYCKLQTRNIELASNNKELVKKLNKVKKQLKDLTNPIEEKKEFKQSSIYDFLE